MLDFICLRVYTVCMQWIIQIFISFMALLSPISVTTSPVVVSVPAPVILTAPMQKEDNTPAPEVEAPVIPASPEVAEPQKEEKTPDVSTETTDTQPNDLPDGTNRYNFSGGYMQ